MKVLILGDGMALTTGFSQVCREAAIAFKEEGWDVVQMASMDVPPMCDSRPYWEIGVKPYFPRGSNVTGSDIIEHVVDAEKPDVIFINADAGMVYNWQVALRISGRHRIPSVVYAPIEGAPIQPPYAAAFSNATVGLTYTKWSSDKLRTEHNLIVPWVYHGVDPDVFHPLDPEKRAEIRELLGWTDKFVVMYVARNAGRKAHDRLIKAMAYVRQDGDTNTLLYLHCKPYDGNYLAGWDLQGLAHYCGVTDAVAFPEQHDSAKGESQIGLALKYGAADLFVSPSKVEGFGLPLIEAMASGLPVAVTNDQGNQLEVVGDAAVAFLEPIDWDTWFTGAQLANVDPISIARVITACQGRITGMDGPKAMAQARERSLARARVFDWQTMREALVMAVKKAAETPRIEEPPMWRPDLLEPPSEVKVPRPDEETAIAIG